MAEHHLLSPAGFRAGAVYAGIKSKPTPDVGLLVCERAGSAVAAFTTNKVQSPAVTVGREHVRSGKLRGVVVNSGNANACTGAQGKKDALRMCAMAGSVFGCKANEVLPSSTGIIGHLLPMEKVERGIVEAGQFLGDSLEHALAFSSAIMTTDTKRKQAAVEFTVDRQKVILAGVCKGSGMIGPRLAVPQATMLAYLTTDVQIAPPLLRKMMNEACENSFNSVTVDDHASTNDTACLLASGLSGVKISNPRAIKSFAAALKEVTQSLAYQIAADGEGATKVVAIHVKNAKDAKVARAIARTIANSNLVKCAIHGNDPNWGRIVSAAGYAGVAFDDNKCVLKLQGTVVFKGGRPVKIDAEAVSKAMDAKEVNIELDCRVGKGNADVWTCDLSKEYITINADYHT